MKPLVASTILDSHRLLEHYYFKGFVKSEKRTKEYIFTDLHTKDPYKPDYIYKNVVNDFMRDKPIGTLLCDAFDELSHLLVFRGDKIYVENAHFERWQEIILTVSPLAIISYKIYKQAQGSFRVDTHKLIASIFDKSALPSIYEPQLDHMIAHGGLNEMHMHLNGGAEADIAWHDALNRPSQFYKHLQKSLSDSAVTEQYLQLGDIEQPDLFRLLMIARQLRDTMIRILYNVPSDSTQAFTQSTYDMGMTLFYASTVHPMREASDVPLASAWQYESLFLIQAFEHLQSTRNIHFSHVLHYYVLIYSFFQKILVQQKTQVGFDQFQKITLNQVRELTEEAYKDRYRQLHGMYDTSLAVLEGRFAPKDTHASSHKLLTQIKKGHSRRDKFKLLLVPHFVKLADERNPKNIITYRDLKLRIKNRRTLDVLLDTMTSQAYKDYIVGFDAAANELHASPEAFAPIFRKLRFLGYSNFTYHAGEDFIHLISGLRMVYEAVEFLDMSAGNRIGHATALGIDPALWVGRLYESKLTLKKGEWLDNLIFAYALLQEDGAYYAHLGKLQGEIFRYFHEIYTYNKPLQIHHIIEAWKARKYDPSIALKWKEPSFFEEFESKELKTFSDLDQSVQELYELYHTSECIERYNQMIQIAPDEKPFDIEVLYHMQNMMINLVNTKGIALETLPTSNVRISYYKRYDEHHLWRWMGLKNYREGDPMPTVVVGSDDTGIFMTNLRNEYAHIYQTLTKSKNREIAFHTIELLNKNSKAFTFR